MRAGRCHAHGRLECGECAGIRAARRAVEHFQTLADVELRQFFEKVRQECIRRGIL